MLSVLFAKEVLKELWAYSPAVVPILLVFYLESSTSLQVWKAARILAHREPHDASVTEGAQKDAASLSLPKRLGLILGILSVVSIVISLHEAHRKIFFLCALFISFMNRVAATTGTWYGIAHRDAIRTKEGHVIYQTSLAEGVGCITRRSFDVLGAVVAFAALWYELPIAISIVYASVLQFWIRITVNDTPILKPSFRRYFWIVNGMVIFLLLLMALGILLSLVTSEGVPEGMKFNIWVYIITSALYLLAPFGVLSILLRFDYANSLPIDSPPPADSTTITSIRLSCYEITTFPKPYFKMAFLALVVVFVGLATLSAGITQVRLDSVGFVAAFGSAPVMVYGALGMAALKGQLRELWSYEEDWVGRGEVSLKESLKIGESGHSGSPLKPSYSTDAVAA